MENKRMLESLSEALTFTKLRDLPKEDDGINVYIRAIAHVRKADSSENYAILFKNKNGEDYAIKDFGRLSPIKQIVKVYPYDFLQMRFLDVCQTDTKEERLGYIEKWNKYNKRTSSVDYTKMSVEELDDVLVNIAIERQYEYERSAEDIERSTKESEEKVAKNRQLINEAKKALKDRTITVHENINDNKRGRKRKE